MTQSRIRRLAITIAAAAFVLPIPRSAATSSCLGKAATIEGTPGDDQLTGTRRNDVIVGRGGNDSINGLGGRDLICGDAGDDALLGGAGRDVVSGDAGGDQVAGGSGDDRIAGGKGLDFVNYFVAPGPVQVDLAAGASTGDGNDTLEGIENIIGSLFGDDLTGDPRGNLIQPLDGNDRVVAGDGIDLIYDGIGPGSVGSDGDDTLDGGASYDGVLYTSSTVAVSVDLEAGTASGDGTDGLTGFEGVFGSPFDDVLEGNSGANLFLGLDGNDAIDGREGGDAAAFWFAGGPVKADLATGEGTASGEGTDGFTNVEGLLGSVAFGDELRGDSNDNLLDGDGANDDLAGLGGDDWLVGGSGNDVMDGGEGDYDLIDFSNTAFLEIIAAVDVDLAAGAATGQGNDTFSAVEAVMGSALGDVIVGDEATNQLFGLAGDDDIRAAGGDDFLDGGTGPDTTDGGPGTDQCVGASLRVFCEGAGAAPEHPVLPEALVIEGLRRNFRRNF